MDGCHEASRGWVVMGSLHRVKAVGVIRASTTVSDRRK